MNFSFFKLVNFYLCDYSIAGLPDAVLQPIKIHPRLVLVGRPGQGPALARGGRPGGGGRGRGGGRRGDEDVDPTLVCDTGSAGAPEHVLLNLRIGISWE